MSRPASIVEQSQESAGVSKKGFSQCLLQLIVNAILEHKQNNKQIAFSVM
jgi:hypothetical protein